MKKSGYHYGINNMRLQQTVFSIFRLRVDTQMTSKNQMLADEAGWG